MYVAIVLLPFFLAILLIIVGKRIGAKLSYIVTCNLLIIAILLSLLALKRVFIEQNTLSMEFFKLVSLGSLEAVWSLHLDALSTLSVLVVLLIATLVIVHSFSCIEEKGQRQKFLIYVALFITTMIMFVTSDNLLQIYFGWECLGIISYFSIGINRAKTLEKSMVLKFLIIDRISNFFILLFIIGLYLTFDSIVLDQIFQNIPIVLSSQSPSLWLSINPITILSLFLALGAIAKSAQIGFHIWLPATIQGSVSITAIIHCATTLVAGGFILVRFSPMIEYAPNVLLLLTIVGTLTIFFAASVSLCKNNIRNAIAYLKCSQLGYVFLACGVSAYSSAVFHLFCNAFITTLLVLGAGAVSRAISNETDMQQMGGLRKYLPFTYWTMVIGMLAMTGIPFLSVYYSRGVILEAVLNNYLLEGQYSFYLIIVSIAVTALACWRIIFLTFHGNIKQVKSKRLKLKEGPLTSKIPLVILTFFAVFSGWIGQNTLFGDWNLIFWSNSIFISPIPNDDSAQYSNGFWLNLVTSIMLLTGMMAAYLLYISKPLLPKLISNKIAPVYLFFKNDWFIDKLYIMLIVTPAFRLHKLAKNIVGTREINNFSLDGFLRIFQLLSRYSIRTKNEVINHYALFLTLGIISIVLSFIAISKG